ncbi:putative adenosine deaminase [Amniculicola lignicola CBS 123094]|uniref:Putative adenosine deaminase n=1 Tax=Amniculicola lignicola CBS 123094 TaxID=1392246 RepID=A0A6A5VZW7_9PLEO|nr:putative adenosine deaminase [Amniculicola lignicola CBS 123094]
MNGLELSPFIKALPKVELHVHIEGTLTPALRWKLAHRNGVKHPYETYGDQLDLWYSFPNSQDGVTYNHRKEVNGDDGCPTFLEAYFAGCQVLVTEDDFYELGMAYLERCKELNVRYCESFFDTQTHLERGISHQDVMNGNLIFCFLRDRPLSEGLASYEAARPWARLADGTGKALSHAVGLAANEFEKPPLLFEEGFQVAGKDDAADHVHEAIFKVCGGEETERIDHGLNALDRPELLTGLEEREIGLNLCPYAYYRRQATEVLFPKIKKLIDEGVNVCINGDDPTYMHDVWMDDKMQEVYTYCGLSKADMVKMVKRGRAIFWVDESLKTGLPEEMDTIDMDN